MKIYRVHFQVTQDFYEEVYCEDGETAIKQATTLLEDNLHNRYAASQSIDVVKVEEV